MSMPRNSQRTEAVLKEIQYILISGTSFKKTLILLFMQIASVIVVYRQYSTEPNLLPYMGFISSS